MDKQNQYQSIVDDVNNCKQCDSLMTKSRDKSSQIMLEHACTQHVNLWSYWQGCLSPEILVIGQDWGRLPKPDQMHVFTNCESYRAQIVPGNNPTDIGLLNLFKDVFNVDILHDQKLFFTNSVFCYKSGNLNENVRKAWFNNCNSLFMGRLTAVLEPKCIVTLGKHALDGLACCGDIKYVDNNAVDLKRGLKSIVEDAEQMWWCSTDGKSRVMLFPAFHPGSYSRLNRPYAEQLKDWERIEKHVKLTHNLRVKVSLRKKSSY